MADRISWIKNLLGHGTTAEQQMVREAAEHARKTGNEMMLVGEQGHPKLLPDFLRSYGTPTEVRTPGGYDQFMLEAGKQGIPVSSAHPHPTNIALPSMGDYHVWANANNFYDNASNNLGSGTFLPDLARENMWIAGPRGPNDVTHVPAMPNRGGSEDYELLRKIKELGAKNDMNLSRTGSHGYNVSRKFDDYTGSWGLSPEQRPELYGSIADVPLYNRLAGLNPIHMDPQTQLVKGRPDILAGDVFPEWMKLLDQHNLDPTKARGGQIPGYAGGGLEHIFDFLKGVTKPIRTYQGSPYKFDKFDPTKIGSGEGSAAYGHGFYSAEAPQVAQEYRRITSHKSDNPAGWMKYGMPVDDLEAQRIIRSLAGMHLPYDEDPRMMDLLAKSVRERMARGENSDQIARGLGQRAGGERYAPENIDAIKQGLPPGYAPKPPGYLYHLDINAHPNQFLDWDAPLNSPANQRIMDRIGDKHMNVVDAMDDVVDRSGYNGISSTPEDYTGRDLHRALSHHEAQEGFPGHIHDEWNDNPKINTASFLSSLDVPGVRFLDKFSRPKNAPFGYDQPQIGTRNYVMFPQSSDLIDIVNREKARGGQIPGYAEGGYDDPSQGYSIPPGSFGPSSSPTPTFQMPIGKGQATVGGSYDLINKIIEAQLGYEHPVGSHGARLGVSGNFNKYIGEGGDQAKPNWGVGLRLNLPFAEGGQYDPYDDIAEAQRLMGAYK